MTAFYEKRGEDFIPLLPATGPWDPQFQNGVALSGLMAHAMEVGAAASPMGFARFDLDIFKPTAMAAPMQIHLSTVRNGRRLQVIDAELVSEGELAARATAVRLRLAETPDLAGAAPPPAPETLEAPAMSTRRPMRGILQSKLVRGGLEESGPGAAWVRFDADIVAGAPITPLVAAAMASDFGSALSSVLDWRKFTFANVDISLNLTRAPRDLWIHVASETVTHGEGRALVNTVLSDRFGDFARAHQTLFVDARPQGAA